MARFGDHNGQNFEALLGMAADTESFANLQDWASRSSEIPPSCRYENNLTLDIRPQIEDICPQNGGIYA